MDNLNIAGKSAATTAMTQQLWGPGELSHYLGCCERTAIKLMRSGELPGFRVGKLWRIRPEDAREFGRPDPSFKPAKREPAPTPAGPRSRP